MRLLERDPVPQAPVEAVSFRAERPDDEPTDAEPVGTLVITPAAPEA